ncbi:DHHA1 domain-containing protein, partial [Streptomyces sp. FH025]|uniref:DHHA1 domain-containing protein n=1 Tax=Streptomyces sp. FH025 TaxID=2815937 RepID=UPI001AD4FBB5
QELARLRDAELRTRAQQLAASARAVPGGRIVTEKVTGLGPDELRTLATNTADFLPDDRAVVILGTEHGGKALLAAAITRSLHDTGTQASQILVPAARLVGGGAGGKGPIASAGGRHTGALDQALALAVQDASRVLSQ